MPDVNVYFDNKKVNEDVVNLRDLEIEVNFDDESGQGAIKSGSLEFVLGIADKINNWNSQGMYGGPGIFEAPPLRLETCGVTIFDGGINTAECVTSYECDKVIAPLRSQTIDFLNDRAPSFSFPYLASLPINSVGRITQSDYVNVPYVINSVPDGVNILTSAISLYVIIKEFREVIEKTAKIISDLSSHTAVAVASLIVPVIGASQAALVVAEIITISAYLLYLGFMLTAIIDLLKLFFDNLIQDVKYKKGMRVLKYFIKACDYLGMTLSSTLLNSVDHRDDVIVPKKVALNSFPKTSAATLLGVNMQKKNHDEAFNPSSTGVFDGTFADLILMEEQRLNAEVRIIGNTLHFETKGYFASLASYTLPDIQRKNADPHGTNACELVSNYLLSYSLDDMDTNTYDEYEGTSCQMILSPNVIINKKNILLQGITEINLQYALAKRKEKDNVVEKIFIVVYNIVALLYNIISGYVGGITGVINAILSISTIFGASNPPQIPPINKMPIMSLGSRKGMMMLSSDFISVPKILRVTGVGKNLRLHSLNSQLTSAATLIDELHFTNFAVRTQTTNGTPKNDHNQEYVYPDKEIPFCCGDYLSVLKNNYVKTFDQKPARIKSLIWNPYKETAKITYRVRQQSSNNFVQKYIIDGKI